jgi:hypothetical protein
MFLIRITFIRYKGCQWLVTRRWFSPGTPVSSTNKNNRHNIAEILLKVALNTTTLTLHQLKVKRLENLIIQKIYWRKLQMDNFYTYPAPPEGGGILFYLCPSQDIFRCIFISNYWWQKSDIWSQASYRYAILWEAFLDPSDSYFLFADLVCFYTHWTYMRGYHKWALAHSSSCFYSESMRNLFNFNFFQICTSYVGISSKMSYSSHHTKCTNCTTRSSMAWSIPYTLYR